MTERESPYLWSTTALTNGSADPNINFAEGQLPSSVNNSARALMAGAARFLQDTNGSLTSGGSANAFTLTINGTQTAYASGQTYSFKANFSNTGASTLNVTNADAAAIGAKAIRVFTPGGEAALSANMILSGGHYLFQYDAAANSAAGGFILLNPSVSYFKGQPGGRLTLTSAAPVMSSSVSAATTVYYTPYIHDIILTYDGTNFIPTTFSELSQATTDTTKSPAAVAANKNYDIFVWNDSGTMRATRGPAWSSDTSRGTGAGTTELVRVKGVLLNTNSITNGPGVQAGTYVGSVRSDGSSQINYIFGASAAGGTAALLGVYNAYNRIRVATRVSDSTASWTYTSATGRAANNSNSNRISFISGLAEDGIIASYTINMLTAAAANSFGLIGIVIDATTGADAQALQLNSLAAGDTRSSVTAAYAYAPQIGFHFIQAIEAGDGTNVTTFFGGTNSNFIGDLRM